MTRKEGNIHPTNLGLSKAPVPKIKQPNVKQRHIVLRKQKQYFSLSLRINPWVMKSITLCVYKMVLEAPAGFHML